MSERSNFRAAAFKQLSAVDVDLNTSNQHEFGTTKAIRSLLGPENALPEFSAVLVYASDTEEACLIERRNITYYDSRRHVDHRSPEIRCYFPASGVFERANPGDTLAVAVDNAGTTYLIVSPAASIAERVVKAHLERGDATGPMNSHHITKLLARALSLND